MNLTLSLNRPTGELWKLNPGSDECSRSFRDKQTTSLTHHRSSAATPLLLQVQTFKETNNSEKHFKAAILFVVFSSNVVRFPFTCLT